MSLDGAVEYPADGVLWVLSRVLGPRSERLSGVLARYSRGVRMGVRRVSTHDAREFDRQLEQQQPADREVDAEPVPLPP